MIHFGPSVVGQTTTGFGAVSAGPNQHPGRKTFHVKVSGSGAVSATVLILVNNISGSSATLGDWVTHGTITISGTTVVSDGYVGASPWRHWRPYVSAISGASAAVDVYVGEEVR
jgi:hypothetical protein